MARASQGQEPTALPTQATVAELAQARRARAAVEARLQSACAPQQGAAVTAAIPLDSDAVADDAALDEEAEADVWTQGVWEQIKRIMVAAGDDPIPRPAAVQLCVRHAAELISLMCRGSQGKRLRDAFPQLNTEWKEWEDYRRVSRKAREQDEETVQAASVFNGGEGAGAASDSDESVNSAAEAAVEDGLHNVAEHTHSAASSRRERQRLADERTFHMGEQDYTDFSRLRERAKLGGTHFRRWCAALLRRSRLQLPSHAKDIRFLARLATTRVVRLVEAANRGAHGARLAPPKQPLLLCHYQHAAEEEKEAL